jgi:hypothetical protein
MTIFDIVNDICNTKTHRLDADKTWDDSPVSPYMLQRWVSMTSPINSFLINEYANRLGTDATQSDKACYHLLSSFCQPSRRKIRYLKRAKTEQIQPNEALEKEAKSLGLSKRDRMLYDRILKSFESLSPKDK